MTETSATESRKPRLSAAQLRPLLPVLALVCGLLALWLAWSGWEQYRAGTREAALLQARDSVAQSVGTAVGKELAQLGERLASAPVQAALGSGDLAGAGRQIGQGWAGVETVEVLAPDLDEAYAKLPQTGYGKLAVAEAAIATGKPVAWVVRDGGNARLGLAAPALVGQALAGVAYVRLPLNRATAAIEGASVDEDSYLALRQGSHSVVERGDKSLATGAESLSTPVPGSDWRVAAALPDISAGPFGLGALACLIGAGVLALLAVVALRAARRPAGSRRGRGRTPCRSPDLGADPAAGRSPGRGRRSAAGQGRAATAVHRPGADRSRHLPRLRHPRRGRADPRPRRRRTDRPVDRLADGRQGPERHRGRP